MLRLTLIMLVVQVLTKLNKKSHKIEKSTSVRMVISLTDTEFQLKTMKLMSLSNFLQILTVVDLQTTEVMLSKLIFHLNKTLKRNEKK
jgi:hypothetical protein